MTPVSGEHESRRPFGRPDLDATPAFRRRLASRQSVIARGLAPGSSRHRPGWPAPETPPERRSRPGAANGAERLPEALLERSYELDLLAGALADVAATGRGRLLLVGGEAGIGKTALLRAFCGGLNGVRILTGACEPLQTARPLGPVVDITMETGGELAEVVDRGAGASDVLAVFLAELRRAPSSVVVLEDLHWADEATLDLVRLLARRIEGAPALIVVTLPRRRARARRTRYGSCSASSRAQSVTRIGLKPLSPGAVESLARPYGVDPSELHGRTSGNPFYVTEVLAAGGAALPASVREAVLARAARLPDGARTLLEAAAIVPPRTELWLLEAIAAGDLEHLEACLSAGMLRAEGDRVAFRHEIARVAIEDTLLPDRRIALHRRALAALSAPAGRRADPARLAHHAEAAGDVGAVLEFAPAAAARAAEIGAHREAAAQLARALRVADALPADERARLLERRAYECYLTDAIPEAIEARRGALAEHRARGDRLREGDTRRWLSRLAWFAGDNATAETEARAAVELLEALPAGPELAMAYSNMSQLRMLSGDVAAAVGWGGRAIGLAEQHDAVDVLAHALNNVGTAELGSGTAEGADKLARSLELALEAGLEEHVARAFTNLATTSLQQRNYALADEHLAAGIDYCLDHDLDSWLLYLTGWQARSHLEQGRWDAAGEAARAVLSRPGAAATSLITPLVVVARLRARRGDPDPWSLLDEAEELAQATGELQRLAPVAAARAEAHWLAGRPELVGGETERALALALENGDSWAIGELTLWRRRAGLVEPEATAAAAETFRLELEGEAAAAARVWAELGCPYEAALALLESDRDDDLRSGLAGLQQLGARVAAGRAARILREQGVRELSRGPRPLTRANPGGLTRRELEVLGLVVEGLRNAQIADRLVLSRKTVDHHVSAILRKLQVSTRTEAAAEAGRLGVHARPATPEPV